MSGLFSKNLEKLDFYTSDVRTRSLLLVSQKNDKNLTPAEVFALENAGKFKATAVYFRQFPDDRPSIPQIYLYDNTENNLSESDLAYIHRDLWSNSRIPMFLVIEKTEVKVFDTREPVNVVGTAGEIIEKKPFDTIQFTADAIQDYSRKLFDSGIFWETEKAKGRFLESTSAYHDLIDNLKYIRDEFLKSANLPSKVAHKLLVFSILLKYLEERGNENESLFAQNFFQQFGAEDFCGVLRQKGKILDLFDELSRHFNGKIFEWAADERVFVENANLNQLAYFLDGNSALESGQMYFWRKYSFNYLPVELISTVYESFLNERKDAVYTPEFLVNTLIDEAMPQKDYEKTAVKTIDVSCGSGIFLVAAFKRLVQRHRYAEFKETGELKSLSSKKLLKIIKDNIFGVDIEEEAVRLTVFSLCLALCDELTPMEIWTELKFDDTFQKNFKAENFFDFLQHADLETYDLIVGNAPFVELSIKKDKNNLYYFFDKDRKRINLNSEISKKLDSKQKCFPQNQLALMFLDQSPRLLKKDGLLCLIMPAAPLLYNNSAEFRNHFFPKYQVLQILDFTSLDNVLFGTAKVPTAAVFVKKQALDEENPITHVTIRRTKSVEEKIFFEIDKYDFHYVSQSDALTNKYVWKCNLLGGGRLTDLICRLSKLPKLKKYISKWLVGEGYIVYRGNENVKWEKADYITGQRHLPAVALTGDGIDESKLTIENELMFERPREKDLFSPPLMVIKENVGKKGIPSAFSNEYLTFKSTIIGISASRSDNKVELFQFYNNFRKYNNLFKFFISATSNTYLVSRASYLLKSDIMNLPYSENPEEMKLSFVEQIICDDLLDYRIEMLAKGSKAKANVLKATSSDLERFGEVFSEALNSIYEEPEKRFFLKKIYDWGEFYITEFNYGQSSNKAVYEKITEPTESIKSLIETEYGNNVYLIKLLKLYERNKVYFIKPKTLRYWLRSIAIKDADEVFSDSIKAGY